MRKLVLFLLLAALPALAVTAGQPAPAFKLSASDGKTYSLEQFHGKSWVVLNFFPKPFTPGCTVQCNTLRDDSAELAPYQAVILGINTSSLELNEKFAGAQGYHFPLLADADQSVAKAYGVLRSDGLAQRRTFIIDPQGVVRAAFDINPQTAVKQVKDSLEELKVPRK